MLSNEPACGRPLHDVAHAYLLLAAALGQCGRSEEQRKRWERPSRWRAAQGRLGRLIDGVGFTGEAPLGDGTPSGLGAGVTAAFGASHPSPCVRAKVL
jgi:hypothetical protein